MVSIYRLRSIQHRATVGVHAVDRNGESPRSSSSHFSHAETKIPDVNTFFPIEPSLNYHHDGLWHGGRVRASHEGNHAVDLLRSSIHRPDP